MGKTVLNFRFHNPNPPEVSADYILKILIEANQKKVEDVLKRQVDKEKAS